MNVPRRCFAGWLLSLTLAVGLRAADVFTSAYISECASAGGRSLKASSGKSGWIELHNGGSTAVNLEGWFLTDSPTNLTRWRLPGVVLLPDKHLLVLASGNANASDLVQPQCDFRLRDEGGYVALVNRATNIVSEINYPAAQSGASFGSVRGEPAMRGVLSRPTPGKANASSGAGFAPEVSFSQASGTFTNEFALTLTTGGTGAVIRFTRDGTLPTRESPEYTAPLRITNSAIVRARAFHAGALPGPPRTEAYVELFTNALEFTSPLPVLVLDTFGKSLPTSEKESFVHVSLFEPVHGKTRLDTAPTLTTRAGFRTRGSSSAGLPQPSFAVQFLDEFNDEQDHALLGLPADSDWVLYAPNVYDPVLIHNPFIHQLSRDTGRYSPRTRFVEVFVVRGTGRLRTNYYHGLYVLTEKVKIAKGRVNIERVDADDVKPPKVTGGYLLKFDRLGPNESGVGLLGGGGHPLVYVEPREQVITLPQRAAQREYLQGYLNDFQNALHSEHWKDPERGYRRYLEMEAAIDYHVLEVLSGNVDAMVLSSYFYKPRGGKLICGPHWDFDRALGSTDGRDDNPRHWNTGPYFSGNWWPRVFSDVDAWQLWADRWQELRRSHFALTNLHRLTDHFADQVREVQPRHYAKWGLQARGGDYQGEVDHMKNWLSNRVNFIDRQFVAAPIISNATTTVTLSAATNSTIHYTLDGSDPRLPQGAVSPRAVVYTNPIPVTASVRVTARALNLNKQQNGGPPASTPWSGAVSAKFEVKP